MSTISSWRARRRRSLSLSEHSLSVHLHRVTSSDTHVYTFPFRSVDVLILLCCSYCYCRCSGVWFRFRGGGFRFHLRLRFSDCCLLLFAGSGCCIIFLTFRVSFALDSALSLRRFHCTRYKLEMTLDTVAVFFCRQLLELDTNEYNGYLWELLQCRV